MTKNNGFKVAALAASIALAMAATSAMAAAPTANQLPGAGIVKLGAATGGTITSGAQTITFTGNTVINWGVASGATINATTQPGGFNVGSTANLGFTDSATAGSSVLNVDVSGNPSQIFGKLSMNAGGGNLYVANSNGIIVGATAQISGPGEIGLIANDRGTVAFGGTAGDTSIEFAGTGGDVSVAKGAKINGTSVLVSGGGAVNVDLSAFITGAATIQAGVKNSSSTLVDDNPAATLTATGTLGVGATLAAFSSAGDASTSGTLVLGDNARVDGTLTNTGDLTLGNGTAFGIDGALVNNAGTVTQAADASMGSLVNNGAYDGATFGLTTTDGGITNNASVKGLGSVTINAGDFTNNGAFVATGGLELNGGGNVVNNGDATLNYVDINEGGNFTNAGTMELTNDVYVLNGSIANSGKLSVGSYLETASDSTAGLGFTKAADYSITNTGTVTATSGSLQLGANSDLWSRVGGTKNDSTGSITNTGILRVDAAGDLGLDAYNDVNLAGTVQAFKTSTGKYAALSATNMLGNLEIGAGDWDGSVLNTDGVATVAIDLFATDVSAHGGQVKLMSNISADNSVEVIAGAKLDTDYAVRVAAGKTVSAGSWIRVDGDQAGDESNVILQGTLEANDIRFGSVNAVSDVFTGPAGSISLVDAGQTLNFDFTGAVKTVPYNNTPTNFRYNGLNVVTDGADTVALGLNPVDYLTSGTSTGSAVNILVNGDVALTGLSTAPVLANGTAVTGVTNIPNTHLVLQSSGNISTVGNFYWPGYVYLGTVAADADGNAMPGTLGFGTITTGGYFNNVLPGDVSGASGIHFITQFPLSLGGDVVTNANAWVNFGTDLLTQGYANGTLGGSFFGGVNTVGTVVSYDELDPSMFHTHAPTAAK